MAVKSSILAALGTKAAAGGAAVMLAAGGAVAAVHATGSTDPVNWGQHIVQVVEGCKDSVRESGAASASRGIGHCVSATAQEHGEQQRAQHSEQGESTASPSPLPGRREGQESPHPSSAASGNGTGAADHGNGSPHPSPAASGNPGDHGPGDHGRPTPTP